MPPSIVLQEQDAQSDEENPEETDSSDPNQLKEDKQYDPNNNQENKQEASTEQEKVDTSGMVDIAEEKKENTAAQVNQDELAEYCFMTALKRLKDKELPVLVSVLYSHHVLPSRPPDTVLDIKKTQYKKASV